MPAERNTFRLGLTIIVIFILFLGVLWFLAPRGGGDLAFEVRFPHNSFATVLKPGGAVTCGGQTIGSITEISLREMPDPDEQAGSTSRPAADNLYTVIAVKVQGQLGLRRDCRIEPAEQLLGGLGTLAIRDRGLGEPLAEGSVIDGAAVSSIADLTRMLGDQLDPANKAGLLALVQGQLDAGDARSLVGKIHRSLDDVNAMTGGLADEFDPRQRAALLGKLHEIMNNVNQTTASLRSEMDAGSSQAAAARVHEILTGINTGLRTVNGILDENREPVRETLAHVRDTARTIDTGIAAPLAEQVRLGNTTGLMAKIHQVLDRLGGSMADVNSITAEFRKLVTLNSGKIDALIDNVAVASAGLKNMVRDVALNPWTLMHSPTAVETAEVNLFGAARNFSDAAARLDNAIARLEALSKVDPAHASPEDVSRLRVELREAREQFTEAEQALWKRLNVQ